MARTEANSDSISSEAWIALNPDTQLVLLIVRAF
jgi:ABC-type hemin transport system substrate-binding protein